MQESTDGSFVDLSSAHELRPPSHVSLPYRLAVGALRLVSPLLTAGDSKLARGVDGRRHAHELLATWGLTLRDRDRPVVWFHAPSVGEGLQARAVIEALRERIPDVQIVYTFFSPSAEELARTMHAEVATYLPWDLQSPSAAVLDALEPDLLVFTKTEVWPILTAEASIRGVPVAIVGAAVPLGAGRMRRPVRKWMESTWACLSLGCANTESDSRGLRELGVPDKAVTATGDPGVDSAASRFAAAPEAADWLTPLQEDPRPVVVAGSTWPADEAVLLPALKTVRTEVATLRTIIAPHEPTESRVASLLSELRRDGWRAETLGRVEAEGSAEGIDAVVVDRVGVLAHLYALGSVSYVGGGFHGDGLHSVLEPAAAAKPIVFGPQHQNARAAEELVTAGGAKIAQDADALAREVQNWLTDEVECDRTGRLSRGYIDVHLGAADRTAELLDGLIAPLSDYGSNA